MKQKEHGLDAKTESSVNRKTTNLSQMNHLIISIEPLT